ncbi:MAG: TOBE domain-containing protein [bacterium]
MEGNAAFLTAHEAASLLHLNVKRVQALARTGSLPATRVGRKWLFPRGPLLSRLGRPETLTAERPLDISARNHLWGSVVALTLGDVMAEVRVQIGDQELTSIITRASAERLRLAVGDRVAAVVKATEVMIGKA